MQIQFLKRPQRERRDQDRKSSWQKSGLPENREKKLKHSNPNQRRKTEILKEISPLPPFAPVQFFVSLCFLSEIGRFNRRTAKYAKHAKTGALSSNRKDRRQRKNLYCHPRSLCSLRKLDTHFELGITNGVMTIRDDNGNVVRDTNGVPI